MKHLLESNGELINIYLVTGYAVVNELPDKLWNIHYYYFDEWHALDESYKDILDAQIECSRINRWIDDFVVSSERYRK